MEIHANMVSHPAGKSTLCNCELSNVKVDASLTSAREFGASRRRQHGRRKFKRGRQTPGDPQKERRPGKTAGN